MKSYNTGSTVCRTLRYSTLLTDDERFYHVLKIFYTFSTFLTFCAFSKYFSPMFLRLLIAVAGDGDGGQLGASDGDGIGQ